MTCTDLLAAAASAALLLSSSPARSQTYAAGSIAGSDVCALRRVNRYEATSDVCLSCHDGTIGSATAIALPAGGSLAGSHGAHPIEVSYEQARTRNLRLHSRYELSRRLTLPGGNVSCVTCHDGASREPHHTALPMARSALCFACHAL